MADGFPHSIQLTVPAWPRFARLARLAASDLATDADFDVEDIEDLKTAVSELFSVLVDGVEGGSDVALDFDVEPGVVVVAGSRPADGDTPTLDPIASAILSVVADDVSLDTGGGSHRFRLVKRSTQDG